MTYTKFPNQIQGLGTLKKGFELGGFEIENTATLIVGDNYYEQMVMLYSQHVWLNYLMVIGENHGRL